MSDGDPVRLRGAQREIRDAYFAADAGLFTLDCVPGAGKSVVAHHVAAEDILRRYAAGDPTPEQHVAVVSFNRDEAADIAPAICDRLRALVEHDLVPAAADVSEAELRYLRQRTRQAPYAGTVDGFLRGIFREFAGDIGFDGTPSVGNDALLRRVHRDCYESLRDDPEHARRLRDLEAAYPEGEYDAGVDEMLADALAYCRDRRLSTDSFRSELTRTRDSTYPGGRPDSFDAIARSVRLFVEGEAIGDREAAGKATGSREAAGDASDGDASGAAADRLREAVTGPDRARLLGADRELYDAWGARIDDFCAVLSAYRARYRTAVREHGAVSHTDVAYLVDAFLDESRGRSDLPEPLRSVDDSHRDRVLRTYRSRIRSLVIDEAQDVSAVQHAALSHVVTSESRVFACGDALQGIYLWRHADPRWFAAATAEGTYLGVDWDTHENRTATTTYRCVPDVAAAINAVAGPVFDDPARGRLGDLDAASPRLNAARDGGDDPAVHVSSFAGIGHPGSGTWADPEGEVGEANMLARHVSRGLADGTFRDADGDPLGVTVLFRRGTRMPEYEAAFADEGLRVRTATDALFDCPAVETALAVCEWLIAPGAPRRTAELLTESPLCDAVDASPVEARMWDLDRVLDDDPPALGDAQRNALEGLARLRDRSDAFRRLPASVYVEDVVEALALRADPNGFVDETDADQRVANLDALVETLSDWEGEDRYPPSELIDLAAPFREDPGLGPTQPSAAGTASDVEFRTVHRAKGDQDDVVVVADPGFDIWSRGPHTRRFVAQGPIAGLAPPTNTDVPGDIPVPPFDGGLYDAGDGWSRDAGLRWATARWRDSAVDSVSDSASDTASADRDALVGPARLGRVAGNERAEAWRLLYVALTRARDHLVVPLPRSAAGGELTRDRWLDALRDGLAFPRGGSDSYELRLDADPNRDAIEVGVNDADLFARLDRPVSTAGRAHVAASPTRRDRLDPWVPRFLSPSTMYPLTEDADRYALAHLLGEPLHTATNEVSDGLPLRFDRLGPEAVGTCLHDALTRLVAGGVDGGAIRTTGADARAAFDEAANALPEPVAGAEREGMFAFFRTVLDDFLDSDLWERIADPATAVGVERPLDGLAEVDDLEVEIHGRADFVVEYPTGERFVTDVKIALAEPTPETRRRYELQIAAYAFLAEQRGASDATVSRTVETFGVATETTGASWPPDIVHRRLRRLLDR
ncbi:UvrD-helicase domain-containing protein [Halorubrum lipolyticum]|uniref:DNA 3'-5' helicase n=1 Tax=Halorubrum lipolyticum DSM 21995 TaxID=1227482 RepID=M0NNJ8_9EURY|nr:UvrD-helicase domain-containing protein [Halorubrum lipolyticum]EMA58749.1 ATP-dependent exoDNAse (exonuclease V) beta subunit-like protein [Halorubrum lipolyticum DSM 21995]